MIAMFGKNRLHDHGEGLFWYAVLSDSQTWYFLCSFHQVTQKIRQYPCLYFQKKLSVLFAMKVQKIFVDNYANDRVWRHREAFLLIDVDFRIAYLFCLL